MTEREVEVDTTPIQTEREVEVDRTPIQSST
jgi:hypothetical protein